MTPQTRTRWVVALLMLFVAINFADKSIIGLAAAPMMKELGLSATEYGTIASSFYLLFSVSAVVFGFLGNRFSAKWMLVALAVIWSAAQLPILVPAAGFAVLLLTRVLLGAGEGPGIPLGMHVAFSWVEERKRGFTAALLTVGSGLGVIIGAPLLNAAIAEWGWRSAFGILGGIGLLWAIAWMVVGGDGPFATTAQKSAPVRPAVVDEPRVSYRRLLTSGTWLGTMFSGFTVYWGLALAIAFLPLYLGQAGFSGTALGFVVTVPAYISIVFMLLGGWLSQRLLRRGLSRHLAQGVLGGAFALVAGISMLLITRVDAPILLLPFVALAFGIGNSQTPLSQAAVADVTPVRQRGATLGIWYAIVSVASVVSPLLTGVLVDAAPTPVAGYSRAFDIAGVLMVLGGLTAMLVVRPDRDAARHGLRRDAAQPAPVA
ncbi:MFS transporter [Pseudonocardia lutea]|uniref:MFS transporter n=1 Tax=Pseudonocardia lutea TaxID=2172015 RepID=A0ABW1I785_9PSEU